MRGFSNPAKGAGIIVLAFLAVLGAAWAILFLSMKPPKEQKLIENFYAHRVAYKRLRDMLLADQQVDAVYADWGVETAKSGLPHKPPDVSFSLSRYNQYVALLEQTGSKEIFRARDYPGLLCIGAWASGWAGNTRHIGICWGDQEPANQVANLDDYYRDPRRPRDVFRHVDGKWYLRADW
jgi:hypothetical protein